MFDVYISLALLATAYLVFKCLQYIKPRKADTILDEKHTVERDARAAYEDIEPLHDFDWSSTPPLKLRPFKPKYHLTMGEENDSK